MAQGKVESRFDGPGGLVEAVLKARTDSRFTQAAKAWRAARKASDESVLPPILPNENAARAGRTLIQIALVVGVPITVGFALRGGRVGYIFVPLAAAGAFVCAMVRAVGIKDALDWLGRGERRRLLFWG